MRQLSSTQAGTCVRRLHSAAQSSMQSWGCIASHSTPTRMQPPGWPTSKFSILLQLPPILRQHFHPVRRALRPACSRRRCAAAFCRYAAAAAPLLLPPLLLQVVLRACERLFKLGPLELALQSGKQLWAGGPSEQVLVGDMPL